MPLRFIGVVLALVGVTALLWFASIEERSVLPAVSPRVAPQDAPQYAPVPPSGGVGQAGLPCPSPMMGPGEVVQTVLTLLRNDPHPFAQARAAVFRAAVAWAFTTPQRSEARGEFAQFVRSLRSPGYRPLLEHATALIAAPAFDGDRAIVLVKLLDATGKAAYFEFHLARQPDDAFQAAGCWMTDGVTRLPDSAITLPASRPADGKGWIAQ